MRAPQLGAILGEWAAQTMSWRIWPSTGCTNNEKQDLWQTKLDLDGTQVTDASITAIGRRYRKNECQLFRESLHVQSSSAVSQL